MEQPRALLIPARRERLGWSRYARRTLVGIYPRGRANLPLSAIHWRSAVVLDHTDEPARLCIRCCNRVPLSCNHCSADPDWHVSHFNQSPLAAQTGRSHSCVLGLDGGYVPTLQASTDSRCPPDRRLESAAGI